MEGVILNFTEPSQSSQSPRAAARWPVEDTNHPPASRRMGSQLRHIDLGLLKIVLLPWNSPARRAMVAGSTSPESPVLVTPVEKEK